MAVFLLMTVLLIAAGGAAYAGSDCYVDPNGVYTCDASSPGSPGSTLAPVAPPTVNDGSGAAPTGEASQVAAATGASSGNPGQVAGECSWRVLDPQPPAGDKLWEGHDPATGVVLYNLCNGPVQYAFAASAAAAPPPPPPPPNPAVLAQQAYTQLALPKPTLGRSPDLAKGDPAKGGQSYTIVNLWTRYFTDPATWAPASRTVTLRGVFATVTATPTALMFDPGDGNAAVFCAGPGAPWSEADGFNLPSEGECGYQYKKVEATPIVGTESISWTVSWIGSGGSGGQFPAATTSASSQFIVEQIQIVVKN